MMNDPDRDEHLCGPQFQQIRVLPGLHDDAQYMPGWAALAER